MQHTLLIAIKCLYGYFFFRWLKLLVGSGGLPDPNARNFFNITAECGVEDCAHIYVCTHTLAKLCLHACVQSEPAAGKTSANYSLRVAFAAQCSMLFDTVCMDFVKSQVSLIEVFVITSFLLPALQHHLHKTMILTIYILWQLTFPKDEFLMPFSYFFSTESSLCC